MLHLLESNKMAGKRSVPAMSLASIALQHRVLGIHNARSGVCTEPNANNSPLHRLMAAVNFDGS